MKLIAGYIRPSTGSILIDQQNLTDVSLKSYYKTIGYLTQEPSVFDGSIRENLLYGLMDIDVSTTHIDYIIHLSKCEWIYDCAQ